MSLETDRAVVLAAIIGAKRELTWLIRNPKSDDVARYQAVVNIMSRIEIVRGVVSEWTTVDPGYEELTSS